MTLGSAPLPADIPPCSRKRKPRDQLECWLGKLEGVDRASRPRRAAPPRQELRSVWERAAIPVAWIGVEAAPAPGVVMLSTARARTDGGGGGWRAGTSPRSGAAAAAAAVAPMEEALAAASVGGGSAGGRPPRALWCVGVTMRDLPWRARVRACRRGRDRACRRGTDRRGRGRDRRGRGRDRRGRGRDRRGRGGRRGCVPASNEQRSMRRARRRGDGGCGGGPWRRRRRPRGRRGPWVAKRDPTGHWRGAARFSRRARVAADPDVRTRSTVGGSEPCGRG